MAEKQTIWARTNMVCGARGTGKSYLMNKVVNKTHFKNVLVYLEPVNIIEETFSPLPVVDLYQYAGGKAIIDASAIDFHSFMTQVEANFRNGLVIIDEAGFYDIMTKKTASGNVEPIKPLVYMLKNQRKINVEIYFVYHSVSEIPVRLIKWINNFILFHQNDEFKGKGGYIPRIEELLAAQTRIRHKYFGGNKHYCERIQLM